MRSPSLAVLLMCLGLGSALAEDTLERIQATRQLRVCIWGDYYGVTYRDPKTRELSGVDIDLAQGLASDLGAVARFVDSAFPRFTADLLERRCDIAMFGIAITAERQAHLHFSDPYLISDIYAITSKGNRSVRQWQDLDTPGNVIAVVRGAIQEQVMRRHLQHARLLVVDTPQAREQEVEAGRADAFMTDYAFSQRMLRTTTWARLIAPPSAFHPLPYAWAMRPEEPVWHQRVAQYLSRIKQRGDLRNIAARHGLGPIVAD